MKGTIGYLCSMKNELFLYNTLSRKKEKFEPIHNELVGMYVCGPTVYGDPHLGHAKSYVSFDLVYRWLKQLGYRVRYVQNITDVGHLTDDADMGDDKIEKQSKLQRMEPMEVVEYYMRNYFRDMDHLNVLRPNISPRPSCHIPEQIEAIEILIKKGIAYEVNGSVYFDVKKYNDRYHDYGKLSGRKIEELMEGAASRALEGQQEKRNPFDFALWKKASPDHIMKWKSPWGEGYPGWHIECTVMSQKYLGETFDIHGGGNENIFPHHECEIAQGEALTDKPFVKYWLHNNMVTVNGQKMGKSLGNSIYLHELFMGSNPLLEKAYSPMTVRFFILQSHYRSTLDFSNEALLSAEKGYKRLMNAGQILKNLPLPVVEKSRDEALDQKVNELEDAMWRAMNDDFNSAQVLANLFEMANIINAMKHGQIAGDALSRSRFEQMKESFRLFMEDVLGLKDETESASSTEALSGLVEILIRLRKEAREKRDFATSDQIRDQLKELGVILKDEKDGKTTWTYA